uniref:Uncharacterized protein n=1 Tax=Ditylenchus dipsaci TaxID=166011 RepID=A0A915DAJ8_9BILA
MLPRSDVPFQVSNFTFPAIIPPVLSRAGSHRSLDSIQAIAIPVHFLVISRLKAQPSSSIMPTSGLSSNTIISTSPVSIRGTARTKSSSLGFTYVSTEPCSYQSRRYKSKEASTKPSSESHSSLASPIARLESIFVSSASDRIHSRVRVTNSIARPSPRVIFSSSCAKSSSLLVVDKCAPSTRRLVSHMVSSSASSHVYAPTPVKRDDEVKSSQLSSNLVCYEWTKYKYKKRSNGSFILMHAKSQKPASQGVTLGQRPTSSDACNTITQYLLHYIVGSEENLARKP